MTMAHRRDGETPTCDGFLGLIVRDADGSLDGANRERLDAHAATCDRCREAVETQRTAHALVAASFDVASSVAFTARVLTHLEARRGEGWLDLLDFRRWTWRLGPVAAGLAVAAFLVATSNMNAAAYGPIEVVDAAEVGVEPDAILVWDGTGDVDVVSVDVVSLIWNAEFAEAGTSSGETQQ